MCVVVINRKMSGNEFLPRRSKLSVRALCQIIESISAMSLRAQATILDPNLKAFPRCVKHFPVYVESCDLIANTRVGKEDFVQRRPNESAFLGQLCVLSAGILVSSTRIPS